MKFGTYVCSIYKKPCTVAILAQESNILGKQSDQTSKLVILDEAMNSDLDIKPPELSDPSSLEFEHVDDPNLTQFDLWVSMVLSETKEYEKRCMFEKVIGMANWGFIGAVQFFVASIPEEALEMGMRFYYHIIWMYLPSDMRLAMYTPLAHLKEYAQLMVSARQRMLPFDLFSLDPLGKELECACRGVVWARPVDDELATKLRRQFLKQRNIRVNPTISLE